MNEQRSSTRTMLASVNGCTVQVKVTSPDSDTEGIAQELDRRFTHALHETVRDQQATITALDHFLDTREHRSFRRPARLMDLDTVAYAGRNLDPEEGA